MAEISGALAMPKHYGKNKKGRYETALFWWIDLMKKTVMLILIAF